MKIFRYDLNVDLLKLALFGIVAFSSSVNAAEHAIVEMECQYSKAEFAGTGTANLSFESASRREHVDVTYVLSSVAMERELQRRQDVRWIQKSAEHYVSAGNVYTLRNVEKRKGLIDDACIEAISLLIAKFQNKEPVDILGVANIEIYLINGIAMRGWDLVHKQLSDNSTELSSRLNSKYYFRSVP